MGAPICAHQQGEYLRIGREGRAVWVVGREKHLHGVGCQQEQLQSRSPLKNLKIRDPFRNAAYLFKDGQLVVRDGKALSYPRGKTLCVNPYYDPEMDERLDAHYQRSYGLPRAMFCVPEVALPEGMLMQTPA